MNLKAYVAEFVGAFALLFCGVGAMAAGSSDVGVAFAHGLAIAVMVAAFGAVSGGHFNPAVTLAIFLKQGMKIADVLLYWFFQIMGAILAVFALSQLYADDVMTNIYFGLPSAMNNGASPTQGFLAEMIGTFFLVTVVLGAAVYKGGTKIAPLVIGLTITASALSIGAVSGSSINPARYLGSAIVGGSTGEMMIYLSAPLAGAVLAGLLSRFLYHKEEPEAVPIED